MTSTALRELLAPMLSLPSDAIRADTPLRSLDSSLGGARLRLGLKRAGCPLPSEKVPATFGELEAILTGEVSAGAEKTQAKTAPAAAVPVSDMLVGLDIQEIDTLPFAADYWDHEFYRGTFDKSEIAYAVVQSEPRRHLAGFWCAKEALRKCDPAYLDVEFASLSVSHDTAGRPHLISHTTSGLMRLPHALSISHTDRVASAVVVARPATAIAPPAPVIESKPATPAPPPRRFAFAASLLVLAIVAIVYFSVRLLHHA